MSFQHIDKHYLVVDKKNKKKRYKNVVGLEYHF